MVKWTASAPNNWTWKHSGFQGNWKVMKNLKDIWYTTCTWSILPNYFVEYFFQRDILQFSILTWLFRNLCEQLTLILDYPWYSFFFIFTAAIKSRNTNVICIQTTSNFVSNIVVMHTIMSLWLFNPKLLFFNTKLYITCSFTAK